MRSRVRAGGLNGLAVALWVLAVVLPLFAGIGCDRKPEAAQPEDAEAPGASTEHFGNGQSAGPAVPAILPAKPAAPKPTGPLAPGTSCVTAECHARLANSRQIHGPVAKGACDSCHEPDTGAHAFPLKKQATANDLCTFCHAVAGTQAHQHKALDQGCVSCHDPHVSTAKFLLKADTVEALCMKCHETPVKRFAHAPFAKGECTVCHQAHQSENAGLLRGGERSDHCVSCHKDFGQKLTTAAHVHSPAQADCNTCHDPHTSDLPNQLRKPVGETCLSCHENVKTHMAKANVKHGAMLAERSCANCHDAHATTEPALLRERMDKVCLTCHDRPIEAADGHVIKDMRPAVADAQFLHGPVRAGNCSACHDAHGAPEHALLKLPFPKTFYSDFDVKNYALCFSCHDRQLVLTEQTTTLTGFRDGDRNLHFVHVNREDKGRSCKSCHNVHGSNVPRHMATEVPFEGSGWSMKIEYEPTPDGGRCSSGCHKPYEYKRSPQSAVGKLSARGAP